MNEDRTEVRLSQKECQKLQVLEEVCHGKRTQRSAGVAIGITDRWVRELSRRLKRHGPRGLAHGNRGRVPWNRLADSIRGKIVQLYQKRYEEFNLNHFREMLMEREGLEPPSREMLRRILRQAGVWERRRDAPKHRQRRPRRERAGELLQIDASIHPWLGEDRPAVALVGAIDDATGEVTRAVFAEAETTQAYFHLLWGILKHRGIPRSLYGDRDSVFVVNEPKERENKRLRGEPVHTQFGRALKELGIEWISAYSPQAKGRIERLWGTFQDRLLKELRLEGITALSAANAYLPGFLGRYNRRFRRPATLEDPVWRPAPSAQSLEGILCWKEKRTLGRDHTFSWHGQPWQVLPSDDVPALTGRRVEVRKTLRGTLQAWYGPFRLNLRQAPPTPPRLSAAASKEGRRRLVARRLASAGSSLRGPRSLARKSNGAAHPWRQYPACRKLEQSGSFRVDKKAELFA